MKAIKGKRNGKFADEDHVSVEMVEATRDLVGRIIDPANRTHDTVYIALRMRGKQTGRPRSCLLSSICSEL